MTIPYLVYCTPEGEIREEQRLRALAFGNQPLGAGDLIPLPDGVTLSMMPDRLAVGEKRSACAWFFRDGNDLGDAFTQGEQPLVPHRQFQGPGDQVIGRQQQPQSDAAAGDQD